MSDSNFSAIRARLKFPSIEAFKEGYGRYISAGGMFVPMSPQKLKPVGTTVRFQFLLADGTSALLGEGVVRQIRGVDGGESGPVGMLVKFTKLSPESKTLVDQVVRAKTEGSGAHQVEESESEDAAPAEEVAAAAKASVEQPPSQDEQHTAEAEIPDDLFGTPDDDAREGAAASGDEIFGSASEPEIPMPGGLDDPSEVVAAALAQGSEPQLVEPPVQPEVPLAPPETTSDEAELDSLDDLFGAPEDESEEDIFAPVEEEAQALVEPEPEPEPQAAPAAPADEDRAVKRTEGGLKVMAFDGDELAEEAAREFEMFAAAGDDDEIDEMFDNIFGGGGDDDFFGGGGGDDAGDFFGGSVEAEAPQPPVAPAPPAFALDEGDDAPMADDDDEVFELESPVDASDSEELLLDEVSDSQELELDEASDSEELLLDEVSDSEELELGQEPSDAGPNEEILSLLSMEEESEAEGELNLSLGAGLAESSVSSADDDEPDSFEALLASAKRELDSKKEPEEEKKGDILDELLGDDDLPPAPAAAPTFAVPQPGEKKKKGGFMSKLFGKD
ncbi:hypothetical protein FRC98_00275 [Lujinxingia vulgaris]|uniref:PilZ domain-containing protein n=1 Tax=Lujinxingia vulgaris TaxID=2600176 RepID=A0A5C6XL06_9DELT|nr:PilZ domain-containing protein [Lujinxingia vulgaris]TXD38875.1 hypothetical protein FRC98_00275 [Lujinxingia vulgaris]